MQYRFFVIFFFIKDRSCYFSSSSPLCENSLHGLPDILQKTDLDCRPASQHMHTHVVPWCISGSVNDNSHVIARNTVKQYCTWKWRYCPFFLEDILYIFGIWYYLCMFSLLTLYKNETHWVRSVMLCHTLFCWTSVMVAVISCLWQMSMQGNLPGWTFKPPECLPARGLINNKNAMPVQVTSPQRGTSEMARAERCQCWRSWPFWSCH